MREDIRIDELIKSEGNKESREDKFNRVDLLAKYLLDRRIIIQVQYRRQDDCLQRMLYGTAKILTKSMHDWAAYGKIARVVSVKIIHFDLGQGEDYTYERAHGIPWTPPPRHPRGNSTCLRAQFFLSHPARARGGAPGGGRAPRDHSAAAGNLCKKSPKAIGLGYKPDRERLEKDRSQHRGGFCFHLHRPASGFERKAVAVI